MSKRVKISFQQVNLGKLSPISDSVIDESNNRIKKVMKGVVREYEKNETLSKQHAALVVLNS